MGIDTGYVEVAHTWSISSEWDLGQELALKNSGSVIPLQMVCTCAHTYMRPLLRLLWSGIEVLRLDYF